MEIAGVQLLPNNVRMTVSRICHYLMVQLSGSAFKAFLTQIIFFHTI